MYPEGYDPWQHGEEVETRRRQTLSMLNSARRELADRGKVTEELKKGLQFMQEAYEDTDATRQIKDFLEKLPVIERMNEIRNELQKDHREVIKQRFEKGELQVGMPMTLQGSGSDQGYGSHEGDDPGASGSGEQRVKNQGIQSDQSRT